ncbi:hypothetical protein PENSPDRAFT_340452 [Peniophora sp. CONT]|nr:hypothetical protein PENSPDRAFT_340452 [Peniophora sp. CONT]
MAGIEQAANAAYVADEHSDAPSSSASPPPAARPVVAPSTGVLSSHVKPSAQNKAPPKPTMRNHDNYTSAAELGIVDLDAQRRMEERRKRRPGEAFVGEWTVVESAPSRGLSPAPREEREDAMKIEEGDVNLEDGVEVGQKRPFPATADDDEDAGHRWKLRKKTATVGLGELYDPGVMKLKPRVKPPESEASVDEQTASTSPLIKEEAEAEANVPAVIQGTEDADVSIKKEDVDMKPDTLLAATVGHEPPPGLFKKRKRPVRT